MIEEGAFVSGGFVEVTARFVLGMGAEHSFIERAKRTLWQSMR
jgi:hypothetical protein